MPPEHQPAAPGAALPKGITRGLHIVAIFEAFKGVIVLAGGLGALSLLNRDLGLIAEKIVRYFLPNPDGHFAQVFISHASHVTNRQLLATAVIAVLYAATRFTEAYGLWKNRGWGEWMAVFGGMIYIPFEVHGVIRHAGPWHITLLASNVLIVLYVARVLYFKQKTREASRPSSNPTTSQHP